MKFPFQDVHRLKEELSVLEERDSKHAEVLKEAVLRAGKILRKAHARENQPVQLKRFVEELQRWI